MKQQKIERFLLEPEYTPLFGITVRKDTDIEDWTNDKTVHQTIKDLVLTTEIKRKEAGNGESLKGIEETSILKLELEEGTRLLWTESQGYMLPTQRLTTRKEIKENLENLDGIEGLE